jgi:cobyric acid synthase CobQ
MGKPVGNMSVEEYINYKREVFPGVINAYGELAKDYDIIVMEGAGSPAEINLKEHDIVNMKMARAAGAKVILTGDIDKGGVFASLVGTLELLDGEEREKIKGFLINKFRGRVELLQPGLDFLTRKTGIETLGVIPYMDNLALPQEDSVEFKSSPAGETTPRGNDCVNIAIMDLPHISNFTDIDPFYLEPDIKIRVVRPGQPIGNPDAVILPGSRNVIADLKKLHDEGYDRQLHDLALKGAAVVGICGGYQMLGSVIRDPHHIESSRMLANGMKLLEVTTSLTPEKKLTQVKGRHMGSGFQVLGYEIHHGETDKGELRAMFELQGGRLDGAVNSRGNVWGTYIHGVFDGDEFRRWFIDGLRTRRGLEPLREVQARYDIERELDRLAGIMRLHLRMDKIYHMLGLTNQGL